jgi:hypothetical protein
MLVLRHTTRFNLRSFVLALYQDVFYARFSICSFDDGGCSRDG